MRGSTPGFAKSLFFVFAFIANGFVSCSGGGGSGSELGATDSLAIDVVAEPATLSVGEDAWIVITVTDNTTGRAVEGATVEVRVSDAQFAVEQPALTDANGSTEAFVTATRDGRTEVVVTARIDAATGTVRVQQEITFVVDEPESGEPSALTPARDVALADGTDEVAVHLTLRDAYSNPVRQTPIRVAASGAGPSVRPAVVETDESGAATVFVRSDRAVVTTLTATAILGGGDEMELDDEPHVEFVPEPLCPSALNSDCTANPTTGLEPNGRDRSSILVTVRDMEGNPVAGVPVQLSGGRTGVDIVQPAPTDRDGRTVGAITSTVRGLAIVTATTLPFRAPTHNCPNQVTIRQRALILFGQRTTMDIMRCSTGPGGVEAEDKSKAPAINGDGRWIVFQSKADNLVRGDTNRKEDIFLCDRTTGALTRVSVDSAGGQANDKSKDPCISGDGRFVAFVSKASNLVRGDTNRKEDVFVHDRRTGSTVRVSVGPSGEQWKDASKEPSISADGRFIAFVSKTHDLARGKGRRREQVFVRDTDGGRTVLVSEIGGMAADGRSRSPSISGDGRFVAFESDAKNLLPSRSKAGKRQVYVVDLKNARIGPVSVDSHGTPGDKDSKAPRISADGRFVVFVSKSKNLVPGGSKRYGIFLRDLQSGSTELLTRGADSDSRDPDLSDDGRFLVFKSKATNLVRGDTNRKEDIFLLDRRDGAVVRLSVNARGAEADDKSSRPVISGNGQFVAFVSKARNLVPNDNGKKEDVFVVDAGSRR